jgi:prepilin-type processing-associated H-X9-DG protein
LSANYDNVGIPLSKVVNPARKIWFADSAWYRWAGGAAGASLVDQESYSAYFESRGAAFTSNSSNQLPSRRHRGGSNFLFFDGHVEWMDMLAAVPLNGSGAGTDTDPYSPNWYYHGSYREMWDPDGDGVTTTP